MKTIEYRTSLDGGQTWTEWETYRKRISPSHSFPLENLSDNEANTYLSQLQSNGGIFKHYKAEYRVVNS